MVFAAADLGFTGPEAATHFRTTLDLVDLMDEVTQSDWCSLEFDLSADQCSHRNSLRGP